MSPLVVQSGIIHMPPDTLKHPVIIGFMGKIAKQVEELARDHGTPADMLRMLATGDPMIRRAVASNTSTPVDVLAFLSRDEDIDVRRAIA